MLLLLSVVIVIVLGKTCSESRRCVFVGISLREKKGTQSISRLWATCSGDRTCRGNRDRGVVLGRVVSGVEVRGVEAPWWARDGSGSDLVERIDPLAVYGEGRDLVVSCWCWVGLQGGVV